MAFTVEDRKLAWRHEALTHIAALDVPTAILGPQPWLLQADVHLQWARWFVESVADPRQYIGDTTDYIRVFKDVFAQVKDAFPHSHVAQHPKLSRHIADVLWDLSKRERERRRHVSETDKRTLLDYCETAPRCWICGTIFDTAAIDGFLKSGARNSTAGQRLPQYLDIMKPRGLRDKDIEIEVDHIVPRSRGGSDATDNLALACGWCNRHKGPRESVYDANGRPREPYHRPLGSASLPRSLPQPFWTVRILATVRVCQHPGGCDRSANNAEVTVAPIHKYGAMNPANLRVTCHEHHPYPEWRLVPRKTVEMCWHTPTDTN